MSKYLYPIYKLKIKSYIRWWLYNYLGKFNNYVLSEILTGLSFYLEDSIDRKFNVFDIIGRSVQDGDPTPENPVPIKNTGDNGSVNEKVQNKNLFDKNIGILSGKGLNADGTTFNSGTSSVHNYIKVKPSTTYTLSGGTDTSHTKRICMYSEENETSFLDVTSNAGVGITFTTTSTTNYIRIQFKTTELENMQLEQGTISTSYVPHSEQNLSFPLAEGQKFYEGSHPDDDEKVHHKWGGKVLDGTEPWKKSSYFDGSYYFYPKDIGLNYKEYCQLKCSHAVFASSTADYKVGTCLSDSSIGLWLLPVEQLPTTADFKAYLAEQYANGTPVIVVFELAEEQTEDFTEEQKTAWEEIKKARTYKNVTHISSEDETPAELKIQYWKRGVNNDNKNINN